MGVSGHRGGKKWQVVAMIMANQSTHCILDSTYMCCNTFVSFLKYIPLTRVGLNILAADHQHFCFCPVSPTATEENPVCQEDSPESIHRTIAHNRVLHSCTVWRDQPIKQLTHHRHSHVDSPAYKQPAVDRGLLTQGCRQDFKLH